MTESAASLAAWSNFYTMVGSSAAALTGLMFVVITLVTDAERMRRSKDGISTFSTPTVVNFCAALLIAASAAAPWRTFAFPAALLGLLGVAGVAYSLRITLRAGRINAYTPDTEDWVWYAALPIVAYLGILGSAIGLLVTPGLFLFVLAGAVMLLIFIGIHNAWDVVTYLAVEGLPGSSGDEKKAD